MMGHLFIDCKPSLHSIYLWAMNRMIRILAALLAVTGLLVSFIFISQPAETPPGDHGTFISSSTGSSGISRIWSEWAMSFPGEEQPQEEDDDDNDPARAHSRFHDASQSGSLRNKHSFDHPSFDQEFISVASPPPKA